MNNNEVAIKLSGVHKSFRLPHEKHTSVKSTFINILRSKRTYEKQKVLNDINFEIRKGEFFGIVGRNGSGKSTLLKLLAGIYSPDLGHIQVNGKLTPFIELGVGFNPELTGKENVFLNGALLGFNRKEMLAMYDEIVGFAELENFMDQKLKNYSSGMQVRLAFSIAIRAKSDILLIDEVLAVGDSAFQSKCYDYFKKLKRDKATVVFVSHDMKSVQDFCDRAILIENGDKKSEGDPVDIASLYLLDSNNQKPTNEATRHNYNAGIELIGIRLNRETRIFRFDDELVFTIIYKLHKTLEYDIGISILKEGTSLHERNTRDIKLSSGKGSYSLEFKAKAGLLLSGKYSINVAAFLKNDFTLLAYINDAAKFIIERQESSIAGLVDMSSEWKARSEDR